MLGKDYADHGEVGYCTVSSNLTCAISIGAKQNVSSLTHDAFFKHSNEDALLAAFNNDYILLAVADAHFGDWASHALITGLAEQSHNISDISSMYNILDNLHNLYSDSTQTSETTLIAISINRKTRVCEGISIGDSTAMIVNNDYTKRINSKTRCYASPNNSADMYEAMADEFFFQLSKNDCLILFTDGVDECHYGHPETSINDETIHAIYNENSDNSMKFTTQLTKLALSGVNNNPGGQDNIAVISLFM
jgi:serine/threonine protein phosphatase PrpC